jgi:hypothetical protein
MQRELLRQEYRAGVVPAAQLWEGSNRGDSDGKGEEVEIPYARGPEEIGIEDMGLQAPGGGQSERLVGGGMAIQGIDVEAVVGRKITTSSTSEEDKPGTPKKESDEEMGGESKRARSESESSSDEKEDKKDKDADIELMGTDGKTENEPKVSEVGADAVDTSTV